MSRDFPPNASDDAVPKLPADSKQHQVSPDPAEPADSLTAAHASLGGGNTEQTAATQRRHERLSAIFDSLPPLGSRGYLDHLRTAPSGALPPEVAVRAYRQLVEAGDREGAIATRDRLLDATHDYFRELRFKASQMVVRGQAAVEEHDLVMGAVVRVLELLPGERGRFAERYWKTFIVQRLRDEWREMHGRDGEEVEPIRRRTHGSPMAGDEPGRIDYTDPAQEVSDQDADYAYWHGHADGEERARTYRQIEATLARVFESFAEGSLERLVAEDQYGDTPSPIDRDTRSADPQTPLTERLGVDRFKISRALRRVKMVLAAALLQDLSPDDRERLDYLIRPVRAKTTRAK
jgi:hypothetical protein